MRSLILIALVCCALAVLVHSANAQVIPHSPPKPDIESRSRRAAQEPPQGGEGGNGGGMEGFMDVGIVFNFDASAGAQGDGDAQGQGGGQ